MNHDLYRLIENKAIPKMATATATQAEEQASTNNNRAAPPASDAFTTKDEIYEYYQRNLIPALTSSLPLLLKQMKADSGSFVYSSLKKVVNLLIPFTRDDFEWHAPHVPHVATEAYGNITQFLLSHFDVDDDGEFQIVCISFNKKDLVISISLIFHLLLSRSH